MILSVASGKGGTGKTTIAVNLALSLNNVQLIDCDVEEPNAHLFLKPDIKHREIATLPIPRIDESLCDYCGKCREVCAYNAIAVFPKNSDGAGGSVLLFPHLCHSCGGCSLLCPQKAINEIQKEIGIIETGSCGNVLFVHGKLNIGEIMSPSLIKQVKKHIDYKRIVIIDSPPGTSCPVIGSVKESDFCILVTEPTPFGLNDLVLAVEMLEKLRVPFGVVINRSDIGDREVDRFCKSKNIPILMHIPFDREISYFYSKGIPFISKSNKYRQKFSEMYETIERMVKN